MPGTRCDRGRDGHDKIDQAFGASQLSRARRRRHTGAALYRQCGGDDRDGVVAQGFAQEEDVAFKKLVADYQKASGNTIDYSIIPYAPGRQKIVSAVTSGVVPDLFQNNPPEIYRAVRLGRQARRCQRCRRDATGGVHRHRAAHGQLLQQCREKAQHLRRALYDRRVHQPHLAAAGRKGGLQDRRHPEDLGCLLRFLQGGAEEIARQGACATSMASVSR